MCNPIRIMIVVMEVITLHVEHFRANVFISRDNQIYWQYRSTFCDGGMARIRQSKTGKKWFRLIHFPYI